MTILSSSGLDLLLSSQAISSSAAREIANSTLPKTETGQTSYQQDALIKPVLDLKKAEPQTSAAAKILDTEQKTLGALLDVRA
jgi:hypothetical protein